MFLRLSYFIEIQLVCEANAEVAKCSKYFTVTSLVALSVIAQYGIRKILDFHTNLFSHFCILLFVVENLMVNTISKYLQFKLKFFQLLNR